MNNIKHNQVAYIVEANSFEKLTLWEKFFHNSKDPVEWESSNRGQSFHIGDLDGRPIWVNIIIDYIDKVPVAFWEATSQVVDFAAVDKWLHKEFPQLFPVNKRYLHTDATNFGLCLNYIKEIDSKKYNLLNSINKF
jgi:hypothetical protein